MLFQVIIAQWFTLGRGWGECSYIQYIQVPPSSKSSLYPSTCTVSILCWWHSSNAMWRSRCLLLSWTHLICNLSNSPHCHSDPIQIVHLQMIANNWVGISIFLPSINAYTMLSFVITNIVFIPFSALLSPRNMLTKILLECCLPHFSCGRVIHYFFVTGYSLTCHQI